MGCMWLLRPPSLPVLRDLIKTGSQINTLHFSSWGARVLYNHDEQSTRGLMNTSYCSTSRLYLSKAILQIQRFLSLTILKLNTADSVQVMSTVSSACSRPHHSLRLHVIEYACAKKLTIIMSVCSSTPASSSAINAESAVAIAVTVAVEGPDKERENHPCCV